METEVALRAPSVSMPFFMEAHDEMVNPHHLLFIKPAQGWSKLGYHRWSNFS
jgi:hypothetical protein